MGALSVMSEILSCTPSSESFGRGPRGAGEERGNLGVILWGHSLVRGPQVCAAATPGLLVLLLLTRAEGQQEVIHIIIIIIRYYY